MHDRLSVPHYQIIVPGKPTYQPEEDQVFVNFNEVAPAFRFPQHAPEAPTAPGPVGLGCKVHVVPAPANPEQTTHAVRVPD